MGPLRPTEVHHSKLFSSTVEHPTRVAQQVNNYVVFPTRLTLGSMAQGLWGFVLGLFFGFSDYCCFSPPSTEFGMSKISIKYFSSKTIREWMDGWMKERGR